MSGWASLRQRLSSELTPRLRFGLVVLLALFLFWAITTLGEDADKRTADVDRMRLELKGLTGRAQDIDWSERAREAAAAREAWNKLRWRGTTSGIAAAEVQAALTSLTGQSVVQSPRIQVSSDAVDLGGQPVLRFEISGVADTRSFFMLLSAIAHNPRTLLIREISAVLPGGQSGRILIAGYAPFQMATEEQSGGAKPQQAQ